MKHLLLILGISILASSCEVQDCHCEDRNGNWTPYERTGTYINSSGYVTGGYEFCPVYEICL